MFYLIDNNIDLIEIDGVNIANCDNVGNTCRAVFDSGPTNDESCNIYIGFTTSNGLALLNGASSAACRDSVPFPTFEPSHSPTFEPTSNPTDVCVVFLFVVFCILFILAQKQTKKCIFATKLPSNYDHSLLVCKVC